MKYENWKFYFREAALISEITQWIMESMRTYGQLSVFIGVIILRKSSHPLKFGGDDRLYRDVDRDGRGFRIPLL